MHADHYFSQAGPHAAAGTPCQDYALSGMLDNGQAHPAYYALVADGSSCAGGVKGETDIGARLVAHAFVAAAKQSLGQEGGPLAALLDASLPANLIGRLMATRFTPEDADLLATLGAVVCDGVRICTLAMGDGVIAVKYLDGTLMIQSTTWNGNVPYYPAYHGLGRFLEFGRHHHKQSGEPALMPYEELAVVTVETVHVTPNPATGALDEIRSASVGEKLGQHAPFGRVRTFAMQGVDTVAVFSDGVTSFRGESGVIALADAVSRLMRFKNFNGRFVARRAIAALGREFPAAPQDDFSMAAIQIHPHTLKS